MRECWEFLFKFEKERKKKKKKINFPTAFPWTVSERICHLAPLTRRMPCATTSACTSALCAWRTWRGQCGQWMRWSTRNAGRRRSRGKKLLLLVHHSRLFPCEIFIMFFSPLRLARSPSLVKNLPSSLGYGTALNASLQVGIQTPQSLFEAPPAWHELPSKWRNECGFWEQ